jgi:PBP1b-binding outer membrane lipoprotein LpoB
MIMEEQMKSNKVFILLTIILTLTILLVGCSKGQATNAPVENPVTTQEPVTSTDVSVETTQAPSGVPEDIPIYPDSSDIQVANQNNIAYKANASIEDVGTFYQTELPNYGWDIEKNPDSIVGNMAQMTRGNANGDRIALSLQYNPVGEFTVIQIYLTRTP